MKPIYTKRLLLRKWQESDLVPFYKLNSNPKVMEFFPKALTKNESDGLAKDIQKKLIQNRWGIWAVEEKQSGNFIGFVGLNQPKTELPFTPCIEIAWRLAEEYWGKGYATEAAKKSLEYAFNNLPVNEVVSFTAKINERSEAVMQRLGMTNTQRNFNHPEVPPHSLLYEHVLYKITTKQWCKKTHNK